MYPLMKPITVLLTGCGAPGAPGIIRCLRNNGEREIRIVGVDMNENAGARGLVDSFHVVPPASSHEYIPNILRLCETEGVDVVLPIVTRELMKFSIAKASFQKLGCRVSVMEPETLALANNKVSLLSAIRDAGFDSPGFVAVNSLEELKQAAALLGYPEKAICVKAAQGNGSRGVRIIDPLKSRYDLFFNSKPNSMYISYEELLLTLSERPEIPQMLVMEYLPGTEYSVDILADRGDCLYSVSRRGLSVLTSNMMSLVIDDNRKVLQLCRQVTACLGLDGNFGFDLLHTANDEIPYILEINPRLTAGVVSCAAAGVNLPYLGIKRLLGEELPQCSPVYGTRMSRHYEESFFGPDGREIVW